MENATKALLIAAAILIVIVLISLGVYVLNMGQEATDSANLNEQEIYAFNSKFTGYEGTQRGSAVNSLKQTVITSNQSAISSGATHQYVELVYGSSSTEWVKVESDAISVTDSVTINTGAYYEVSFDYDSEYGLINKITVTESN